MSGRAHVTGSPPVLRLRRPGWRDPRLLLGIVLVATSVALGSALVTAAGRTVPVYTAAQALVPGDALGPDVLHVQEVRLGSSDEQYLRADEPLPEGLVVTRVVGPGELVPRAALVSEADLGARPVAIEPGGVLPRGLAAGSTVDLWFVPQVRGGGAGVSGSTVATAPAQQEDAAAAGAEAATVTQVAPVAATEPLMLAAGLTVAEVTEPRAGFGIGASATVHVLVPTADLPNVLAALAADGSVEVVLVPGAQG